MQKRCKKKSDRIGIIKGGRIIFVGTVEELKERKNDESLENIFLELIENE
ncbi:ABC transporter, ATP-binding protein [Thermobrachium celere DSM 8682]|uniref:ABC transporter, ATP-binding protein n=1 Tax=Thermobrachium celere DSM 8682 TaxID=941824 RepID=R7RP89_9CLOT|nr:ABC transporter, ATP-binding protein [Thermobrachium celere DSM 8682]